MQYYVKRRRISNRIYRALSSFPLCPTDTLPPTLAAETLGTALDSTVHILPGRILHSHPIALDRLPYTFITLIPPPPPHSLPSAIARGLSQHSDPEVYSNLHAETVANFSVSVFSCILFTPSFVCVNLCLDTLDGRRAYAQHYEQDSYTRLTAYIYQRNWQNGVIGRPVPIRGFI